MQDDGYTVSVNADGTTRVAHSGDAVEAAQAEEPRLKTFLDRIQQFALAYPQPQELAMNHARIIEIIESVDPWNESEWLQRFRNSLVAGKAPPPADIAGPVRAHIASVRRNPNSRAVLRAHLQGRLFGAGQYSPSQLDHVEAVLDAAIDAIPDQLEQLSQSAHEAGVAYLIEPLVEHALGYFLRADDLVSDHLGTLGLLDDTYLVQSFLYRISELYQRHTSVRLVADDLTPSVQVLRWVLGAEIVDHLDYAVEQEISGAIQQPYYRLLAERHVTLHTSRAAAEKPEAKTWEREMVNLCVELGVAG